MKITVDVTADQERQLQEVARRLSIPVHELAAAAVRDLLAHGSDDFDRVASRVLEKNSELYRRLA
jgi:hypothetical protein